MLSFVGSLIVTAAPPSVDFAKEVAPIFAEHCLSCHNANAKKGGYDLSTYSSALKPGEDGRAIVPSKLEESPLLEMIEGKTEPTMPKFSPLLMPQKVDVIRRWIAAGCPCPEADRNRPIKEFLPKPASEPSESDAPAPILALAFHPKKPLLFVPGVRSMNVVDAASKRRVQSWRLDFDRVYSVRPTKEGERLLISGGTPGVVGVVELWSIADSKRIRRFVELPDLVHGASLSPDESLVAAAAADRALYVWETATGMRLHRVENHAESAFAAQFLPDGKRIVTSSRDKSVKIWDRIAQDVAATFANHGDAVFAAAPSPDGDTVGAASADGNIKYWTSNGDGKDGKTHIAHAGGVYALVYSPDGKRIATAGADRNIVLWKAGGNPEKTLSGHHDWVYSLAFTPDGQKLASGSWDGDVRVWEVPSGKQLSAFTLRGLVDKKP